MKIDYWEDAYAEKLASALVGRSVAHADPATGEMALSDGTRLRFDTSNSSCCSVIDLTELRTTNSVITAVKVEDNEDETGGEGEYRAWITVLTDAGPLRLAEADGNASNGYYLHGFALDVSIEGADPGSQHHA